MDKLNQESISLSKIKQISTISDRVSDLTKNLSINDNSFNVNNSFIINSTNDCQSKSTKLFNNDLTSTDVVDIIPKAMSFTWFDILLNLFSIFCYLIDVVSDIITCCVHYQTKNFIFFYLTLVFIILPSLITTFVSLRWYIIDSKNKDTPTCSRRRWLIRILFLIFQMGIVNRYIDSLLFGIKYMNKPDVKYYRYMIHEDTDATLLRLFECFLESAPQLLIQLYLLIMMPISPNGLSNSDILFYVVFPYFSCCVSLFSIALALASYYKSLRMSLPNKINLSMFSLSVQVGWRLFMLASRILAITLFITSYNYTIVIVLLVHWLIMFLWILTMKTNFCENKIEEIFYDALIAIIFIFCYFNPIDNDTRQRYTFFFTFMFVEGSFLLFFWNRSCLNNNYNLPCDFRLELISLYYVLFFIGILIMVFYYLLFHPSRKIKFIRTPEDLQINERRHSYVSRDQQRRFFDERDWCTPAEIERLKAELSQTESLSKDELNEIGIIKKIIKRKRIMN